MKRSIKKHLILALVVAILTVAMALGVSAADATYLYCTDCKLTVSPVLGETKAPQCESYGYTELRCPTCKAVLGQTNKVEALGHNLVTKNYTLSEDETYYEHNLVCTKAYDGVPCGYTWTETDVDNGNAVVKYCKVNFINDFVAVEFETFCTYAKLAAIDSSNAYERETETIYVEFPEDDEETTEVESVTVKASSTPYRMPDKKFGKYVFAGWANESEIRNAHTPVLTTFAIGGYNTGALMSYTINADGTWSYNNRDAYEALIDAATTAPSITSGTSAEYNLYAIFEADLSVEHKVSFYNYDGTLLYSTTVNHATQAAEYNGTTPPRRPDNVEFVYEFAYWELYGASTVMSNGYDIESVYGDLKVMAYYNSTIKQYDFRYFEKDGETPIMFGDIAAEDTVTIAGTGNNRLAATTGLSLEIADYYDPAYHYVHTGKWLIPSRGNYVVDLNSITLPYGTLDNTQIDYIALVPQYQKFQRMYELKVNIVYEENPYVYNPEEISIQVTNAEGKVVGYAEIDRSEKYYKDGTYTVVFDVAYSESYKIAATATGFSGSATAVFHTFDPDDHTDDRPGNAIITMKENGDEPCSCICHTVFKPVWVGILNLLNSLFKLEFVCCDDMFANIGSELNYGPAITQ